MYDMRASHRRGGDDDSDFLQGNLPLEESRPSPALERQPDLPPLCALDAGEFPRVN
eukprot:CAMPEP_0204235682 /NCGR_PEP_ID=MMETSP0361-20130328/91882_1 /ASSEMBLY_ACC=CAM_ASM_000343 /TAXON_ID=268821 /ORGANISM="Scrippsiella Hangoei, Strain SHTV-5" /LENGTH=55 /DNA_ID=CAMNT_0051207239 /DNA_START=18 /DNA_END=183 /DNA_ORIENTATION=-